MRKASIVILVIALITLMATGIAYAAGKPGGGTGTITGTVKDISTGAAISGATVSNGSVSATTATNGSYTITGVATGNVTFNVTKTGYQQTWQQATIAAGVTTTTNWSLTAAYGTQTIPAASMNYAIMAWNDLGMHCGQDDYSGACVLPPYNTVHVQIQNRNANSNPLMSGVTVTYAYAKKTDPTLHNNFWQYCSQYGWNLAPGVGLAGNRLSGTMVADAKNLSWVAEGVPVTAYDDDGTWDPYGKMTVTVKSTAGATLQTADVVTPVSGEMSCFNCHGTTNTFQNVLAAHDKYNGTTLAADLTAGKHHRCSEGACHGDNALGAPGGTGVESLSYAMHNFHASKMSTSSIQPVCYNCHPGPKTNCMRGIMSRAGNTCITCHGDMANVASSQLAANGGRQPWLNEPKCGTCHDSKHAENTNTLYRNSVLQNGPNNTMNNKLYCEACHNSTHAELTGSNAADFSVVNKFQGDNYWVWSCKFCHTNKSQANMHR